MRGGRSGSSTSARNICLIHTRAHPASTHRCLPAGRPCCQSHAISLHVWLEPPSILTRSWDSGETYLVLDRSICAVPEALARRLTVHTSCPATRIVYTPQQQKKGDKKEKKEEKGKQQAAAGGAQPGVVARVTLVGGASGKEGSASSSRPVRLEISAPGDQPAPRVVVHCQDGRQVHAQAVLVTAPLPILKVRVRFE